MSRRKERKQKKAAQKQQARIEEIKTRFGEESVVFQAYLRNLNRR